MKKKDLISITDYSKDDYLRILELAADFEENPNQRLLEGKVVASLFFEPSTRTRLSFETAINRLGGRIIGFSDAGSSSVSKGETLHDTTRMVSNYADLIVMRHPLEGSARYAAEVSGVPVINAGDGPSEHPSQALLDLYTIRKELKIEGPVAGLRIAMVGDLKYGRTVHSLSKLLCLYKNIHFTLVAPKELGMPAEIVDQLRSAGHTVVETDNMEEGLHNNDTVYLTRIQEERFADQKEADLYRGRFRMNQNIYTSHCKPNTVIMHPLPRDSRAEANELDIDLNQNPNLAIFRQTDNGVVIRMALFALALGVEKHIEKSSSDINWYTDRRF
jgi:aspartate carbamoyltransferase catalytic subunit